MKNEPPGAERERKSYQTEPEQGLTTWNIFPNVFSFPPATHSIYTQQKFWNAEKSSVDILERQTRFQWNQFRSNVQFKSKENLSPHSMHLNVDQHPKLRGASPKQTGKQKLRRRVRTLTSADQILDRGGRAVAQRAPLVLTENIAVCCP
jgi:hypothetical protein